MTWKSWIYTHPTTNSQIRRLLVNHYTTFTLTYLVSEIPDLFEEVHEKGAIFSTENTMKNNLFFYRKFIILCFICFPASNGVQKRLLADKTNRRLSFYSKNVNKAELQDSKGDFMLTRSQSAISNVSTYYLITFLGCALPLQRGRFQDLTIGCQLLSAISKWFETGTLIQGAWFSKEAILWFAFYFNAVPFFLNETPWIGSKKFQGIWRN